MVCAVLTSSNLCSSHDHYTIENCKKTSGFCKGTKLFRRIILQIKIGHFNFKNGVGERTR